MYCVKDRRRIQKIKIKRERERAKIYDNVDMIVNKMTQREYK
jgi:hypothetical protein